MKQVLILSIFSLCMLSVNSQFAHIENTGIIPGEISFAKAFNTNTGIGLHQEPGNEKMLAVIFRKQDFCRAELKDFEFDAPFRIVSATVYFSGPNFKNVEKGFITSNSLKPIKSLMDRCTPGTMVIFDNVQAIGPDDMLCSIRGNSYLLH